MEVLALIFQNVLESILNLNDDKGMLTKGVLAMLFGL